MAAILVVLALAVPAVAQTAIDDLPVHVTQPSSGRAKATVVLWSGDGGWSATMQGMADALAQRDYGVVGVSSLRYFWYEQAPQTMAVDTERLLQHFATQWQTEDLIIAGYSFGADTVPFAWPLMSADTRNRIVLIALLSPFLKTEFEISLLGMFGIICGSHGVAAAIDELPSEKVLCLTGNKETDMACGVAAGVAVTGVPGGHTYDRNWTLIADIIDAEVRQRRPD
nr:AcvB/VirJ family lysyl-phosphatidylglycerol hydrolase [Hoeflea prorocentri]